MPGARNFKMVVKRLMPDKQRSQARDLQGPQVIVDSHPRGVREFAQRRIGKPARAGEFADHERHVNQKHPRGGQPEADGVEHRKGDIAHAKLQRQDEVHEPDDERHGHEEDHDRAVRREDLIVMFGRQIPLRVTGGKSQLAAHQHGVREAAHQHQERQEYVHHADALVIDAGDPFSPQVGPPAFDRHQRQHAKDDKADTAGGDHHDRHIEWNCRPAESA